MSDTHLDNAHNPLVSARVVLAVSQATTGELGRDEPSTDFLRLASLVDGVVQGNDLGKGHSSARRLEGLAALDFRQAKHILRAYPDADAYVSFSERVGIPLGMLLRSRKNRPAHILIAHRLNTRAKRLMHRMVGWGRGVDRILVICDSQLPYAERFAPGAVRCVKAGVTDHEFYRPTGCPDEGYILSVGSESRDYDTLLSAASRVSFPIKILCSSSWARKSDRGSLPVPPNVEFLAKVSWSELRSLYDRARAVAVPLHDVDYAAGHNAVLEAFCMAKPVVVSASHGIADYVQHEHNALVVPAADSAALADALENACRDADLRARLGAAGRSAVVSGLNLEDYARTLAGHLLEVITTRTS